MINNEKSNNYRMFQILNVIGFVAMVVVNFLANYLPINDMDTGYISDLYPNLFTPAGFTFAIWGLIYLLLAFFVIYQAQIFGSKGKQLNFVKRIGYLFFTSCLLNLSWIFAWHYLMVELSLVIMILLLVNLIVLYNKLNQNDTSNQGLGEVIIQVAFSIYLGWITIATVANVTALLVDWNWNGFGLSDVFWMIVVMLVATIIVIRFMFKNNDWVYSLVALWAYFGIAYKRLTVEPVETAVVVVVIICMIAIAAGIIKVIIDRK
jgi:hypothetical protein